MAAWHFESYTTLLIRPLLVATKQREKQPQILRSAQDDSSVVMQSFRAGSITRFLNRNSKESSSCSLWHEVECIQLIRWSAVFDGKITQPRMCVISACPNESEPALTKAANSKTVTQSTRDVFSRKSLYPHSAWRTTHAENRGIYKAQRALS
jgi:hypothetical protein